MLFFYLGSKGSIGMPEAGATPNKITFNASISACEKAGQWQRAIATW